VGGADLLRPPVRADANLHGDALGGGNERCCEPTGRAVVTRAPLVAILFAALLGGPSSSGRSTNRAPCCSRICSCCWRFARSKLLFCTGLSRLDTTSTARDASSTYTTGL